ncbi:MAG TPA: hypothetical protein VFM37_02055, partial [Pseudonocardiaceae bacterium]|nr:hypothetical protein [Pseudonocardiaceae bacterium]
DLEIFSAPLSAFFTAPPESKLWGELHASARAGLPWAAEQTLLPGFVLIGLAAAGLIFSIWTARQRALLAGGVALTVGLAMGTRFAGGGEIGYVALYEYLPGWDGIRTPGRLVLWTTLLLGILAAGAVCAFGQRVSQLVEERAEPGPGVWLRLAMLVPLVLVLGEGLNNTPHPIVPTQPAAMRVATGPLLVLPSDGGTDNHVMLWSTSRFQPVVNGNSGFVPLRLDQIRRTAETFPDQASIAALREQGVVTVLVLHDRIDRARWQAALDAPVEVLGVTRQDVGGDLLFQLSP